MKCPADGGGFLALPARPIPTYLSSMVSTGSIPDPSCRRAPNRPFAVQNPAALENPLFLRFNPLFRPLRRLGSRY
jgi:hypothetical protein